MKKIAQKLGDKTFLLAVIPGAVVMWGISKLFIIEPGIVLAFQIPLLFIQIFGLILYVIYLKNS